MAQRLTPRTLDLEVWSSSLARRVVSLDLFTQVYKWVPARYCWRETLRWTSIPYGRRSNAPRLALHATETGISSCRVGLERAFTLPTKVEEARGNRDCRSLDVNCKSCMKQRLNHNRKQRGNKHKISFLSYLCFCLGRTFTFFTPRQKHAKKKKVKVNPQKLLLQSLTDADG